MFGLVKGGSYAKAQTASACSHPITFWKKKWQKEVDQKQRNKRARQVQQDDHLEGYRRDLAAAGGAVGGADGIDPEDCGVDQGWQNATGQQLGRVSSVTGVSSRCDSSQPRKRTKEELHVCNQFLAKGMLAAGIPANALDCQPFREALMAVAEFGAGFKPMGRKDYYRYYCPKVKADLVEEMKKYEEVLDEYGCTVCTDGWKAVDNKKLMNGVSVNIHVPSYFCYELFLLKVALL